MKKYFFFIIIIIIIIINILYAYYNNKNYEYYSQIQDAIIFTDNMGKIIGTYPENIYNSKDIENIENTDDWRTLPELLGVVNNPIFVRIPNGNPGNDGNPGTQGPIGTKGPEGPRGPHAFSGKDKLLYQGATPSAPTYSNGENGKSCFDVNSLEGHLEDDSTYQCKNGLQGPPGDSCYTVMQNNENLHLLRIDETNPEQSRYCHNTPVNQICKNGDDNSVLPHENNGICPPGIPGPLNNDCIDNSGECIVNFEKCTAKYNNYEPITDQNNINIDNKDIENAYVETSARCDVNNTMNNGTSGKDGLTCRQIYEELFPSKNFDCNDGTTDEFCFNESNPNKKICRLVPGEISNEANNLSIINIPENTNNLRIKKNTTFNDNIHIHGANIIFEKNGSDDIIIDSDKLDEMSNIISQYGQACEQCGMGEGNVSSNCNNSLDKGECTPCPVGTESQDNKCIECEPGYFQTDMEQSTCEQCDAGTYASNKGQSTCEQCDAGTYASNKGQSKCEQCDAGTYASGVGNDQCKQCDAGTYASGVGNDKCEQCDAGTYASNKGQSKCEQCDAGTYASGVGNVQCQQCDEWSYAPGVGNVQCQPNKVYDFSEKTSLTEWVNYAKEIGGETNIDFYYTANQYDKNDEHGVFKKGGVGYFQLKLPGNYSQIRVTYRNVYDYPPGVVRILIGGIEISRQKGVQVTKTTDWHEYNLDDIFRIEELDISIFSANLKIELR